MYIFVYMWGAWDIARVTALSGIASFLTTRWFRGHWKQRRESVTSIRTIIKVSVIHETSCKYVQIVATVGDIKNGTEQRALKTRTHSTFWSVCNDCFNHPSDFFLMVGSRQLGQLLPYV